MFKYLFFILVLLPAGAQAEIKPAAQSILEEMTFTYSQVAYMKASFNKTETSGLLGTQEKNSGNLEYSRGRVRVELKGEKSSLFIKGDKKFWQVGSDGAVVTGSLKKSFPNIFEAIFTDPKVWKKMEVKHSEVPDEYAQIKVDTKGQIPNVKSMNLKINLDKKTLEQMTYTDDINNQTKIAFQNIRFFKKAKEERFKYKINKKSKVTYL